MFEFWLQPNDIFENPNIEYVQEEQQTHENKRSFNSELLDNIGRVLYDGLAYFNENDQVCKIVVAPKFYISNDAIAYLLDIWTIPT